MENEAAKEPKDDALVCQAAEEECEEACRECEEAIRECEEAALSCRYLLSVCVIIIILLGSLLVYLNLPYDENGRTERLDVYYIMPAGCVDCDPNLFYDQSRALGVEVSVVESSAVKRSTLFVRSGNRSVFGSANSKLNFLDLLCDFASLDDACVLLNESEDVEYAASCVESYNLSRKAVFFYTQDGCEHCSDMVPWIRDLKKEGYEFYTIDIGDEDKTAVADSCLSNILDLRGNIPQFACAGNGKANLGAFASIDEMRSFADACAAA